MTKKTNDDSRYLELKALADAGDECAAADLFKEFGEDATQEAHDDTD